MIPTNIKKQHLLQAIAEIDREGVPPHQQSTGYDLVYKNKRYPPKLVVRIANRIANGRELWNFSGGAETNSFLEAHHFTIVPKAGAANASKSSIAEYHDWLLDQLLAYRQTNPGFYFLPRTNKSPELLKAGHWFPGDDSYLHVALTRRASGDTRTKSVGLKIAFMPEERPCAWLIVLFKQERDPAVLAFYRGLVAALDMRAEGREMFALPYGEDLPAALNLFLNRDVPIFQKLLREHGLEEVLGISPESFSNKLNNVLRSRNAEDGTPEPRRARLCWNTNGWVAPSGPVGKSADKESFERQYGFGFEEWLFDFDRVLDDGYQYGFLQPVNQEWQAYAGKCYHVRLYARYGESGQRYWIGEIVPLEVIDHQTAEAVESEYRERGWIGERERQLAALNLPVDTLNASRPEVVGAMFNLRFLPQDAHLYPDPIPFSDQDVEDIRSNRYQFLKATLQAPAEAPPTGLLPFRASGPPNDAIETISRSFAPRTMELPNLHHQIQRELYDWLVRQYGEARVSWEQPIDGGGARIDLAVKTGVDAYDFYEVKTYPALMSGIRVALGQLLEYAYFPKGCRAERLIIVSYHEPEQQVQQYLDNLRKRTGLQVFYAWFDLETGAFMSMI